MHDLMFPTQALMAKISTSIDFITKSRKRKERANVEKARKWKFLYSLFKSHPSPKALRTCLDLPCRRSCKPPASQWPSPSQCCWPWWCSAPAPRAPWAVSCLPATAIWKASHFESDGESAHCVLSEGQDWLQIPQTLVHGTRLEKTEATAVVHELLQQTFQLFSPRALLQVETRASWTDSSWDLISSWRTWTCVWGREGHWKSHL